MSHPRTAQSKHEPDPWLRAVVFDLDHRLLPGTDWALLRARRFGRVGVLSNDSRYPEAFTAIFARLGLPPSRIVVVGDSLENDIAPAMALGCAVIHLDREGSCTRAGHRCVRSLTEVATWLELAGRWSPGER